MTDRWIIAAVAVLVLLLVGSLTASGPLLKRMLTHAGTSCQQD